MRGRVRGICGRHVIELQKTARDGASAQDGGAARAGNRQARWRHGGTREIRSGVIACAICDVTAVLRRKGENPRLTATATGWVGHGGPSSHPQTWGAGPTGIVMGSHRECKDAAAPMFTYTRRRQRTMRAMLPAVLQRLESAQREERAPGACVTRAYYAMLVAAARSAARHAARHALPHSVMRAAYSVRNDAARRVALQCARRKDAAASAASRVTIIGIINHP